MITITKERLLTIKQWRETYGPGSNVALPAEEAEELAQIALASLEAKPIGAFHIAEQQVDGTSDYLKDGEWPIDNGIIEVYAASPMTVVLNDVSGPLALAYKELTPAIMRNHIAVFERYGITPNDSITTIHALRIALDGIERSDAMLHAGNFRENSNSSTNNFREIPETSTNYPELPDSWISCSERMPVIGELNWRTSFPLLITCEIGVIPAYYGFVSVNGDRHYGFMESLKYGDDSGGHPQTNESGLISNVTHWMPLPEPPEQDGE
ncbi:DUF551 domain-containing protein [Escherichia coli]|nr:DUF551 domain-containing protein [Escherichia coli]